MDLHHYADTVRRQLLSSAEAAGEEARVLAERLVDPLDAAIQLAIQEALAEAAEELTLELAPGSVELRLRGRELGFAVTLPPADAPAADDEVPHRTPSLGAGHATDGDEGEMQRINLRLPEHLKSRVEQVAGAEGLSVNAWLVRAAAAGVARSDNTQRHDRGTPQGGRRYRGWAR
jgi:hypothetical protein